MKVILKRGTDPELNEQALAALRTIPEIEIVQDDTPWLEGRGGMPAVWFPDGRAFSGIDAITKFVAQYQLSEQEPDIKELVEELAVLRKCTPEKAWQKALGAGRVTGLDPINSLVFCLEVSRTEHRQGSTIPW